MEDVNHSSDIQKVSEKNKKIKLKIFLIFFFFTVVTNPERGLLRVGLLEGSELVAADVCGTSDPYCKMSVAPLQEKKPVVQKSSIIEYTLNPIWNEAFIFEGNTSDILTINCYDKDAVGSDDFLGRIQLPLDTLMHGVSVEQWIPLQLIEKGYLRVKLTALDFGKPPEGEAQALVPLECVGSTGLLSKLGGGPKKRLNTSSSGVVRRDTVPIRVVKQNAKAKAPGDAYVSKAGHMEKLPTKSVVIGISQGWQRRFFRLEEHKLCYYRSSKDNVSHILGSIGLKNAVLECDETENEYTFKIKTKAKTIDCKAVSDEEFTEWYHAINTNITVAANAKGRFDESEAAEDSEEE